MNVSRRDRKNPGFHSRDGNGCQLGAGGVVTEPITCAPPPAAKAVFNCHGARMVVSHTHGQNSGADVRCLCGYFSSGAQAGSSPKLAIIVLAPAPGLICGCYHTRGVVPQCKTFYSAVGQSHDRHRGISVSRRSVAQLAYVVVPPAFYGVVRQKGTTVGLPCGNLNRFDKHTIDVQGINLLPRCTLIRGHYRKAQGTLGGRRSGQYTRRAQLHSSRKSCGVAPPKRGYRRQFISFHDYQILEVKPLVSRPPRCGGQLCRSQ